jgi:hypothetical protein
MLVGGKYIYSDYARKAFICVLLYRPIAEFSYLNAPESDAMKAPVAMLEMSYIHPC